MKKFTIFFLFLTILVLPGTALAQTLIYSEGFENLSSLPSGWTHPGTGSISIESEHQHTGNNCLKFSNSNSIVAVMPSLGVDISDVTLTFWECPEGSSSGDFDLGYVTDASDASSFVQLMTWNCSKGIAYAEHANISFAGAPSGARIAFRQRPANTYWYWFVDDIEVYQNLPCNGPVNIYVSDLSTNGATLNWSMSAGGTENPSVFQIEVKDENGTVVYTDNQISGSNYQLTLSGLSANTTYSVRMRGDCDASYAGYSSWTSFSFTTVCNPTSLPYSENFDNLTDMPDCTASLNTIISTSTKYGSSGKSLQLSTIAGGDAYMVFPSVSGAANNLMLTAMLKSSISTPLAFIIGTVSDMADVEGSFEPLYVDSLIDNNWHEISMSTALSSSTAAVTSFCIFVPGGQTASLNVDDVNISTIPSCIKPGEAAISLVTDNSITLSWKHSASNPASYVLVYELKQGSNTVASDSISLTGTSYTFSNLASNSSFSISARIYAACSAGGLSEVRNFSGNATTPCAKVSVPYFEDFNAMTNNTLPVCWDISASTTETRTSSTPHYIWGVYKASNNMSMRLYNAKVKAGVACINSPVITLPAGNGYELEFDYSHRANCGPFTVSVSTDYGNTFTQVASYTCPYTTFNYSSPGTFYSDFIDISQFAGNDVIIRFSANASYGSGAIFIDNVSVHVADPCAKMRASLGDVTENSAQIIATETCNWQISYGPQGTAPENGTIVNVTNASVGVITGLSPVTDYVAYARRDCGSETGAWTKSIEFRTSCPSYVFPYSNSFDEYAVNALPECWNINGSTTTTTTASYLWAVYNYNGNKSVRLYNAMVRAGFVYLNSPNFRIPAGGNYKVGFSYSNRANCGNLDVQISTDGGNNFTTIASLPATGAVSATDPVSFVEKEIGISEYAGNDVIIRFAANANYSSGAIFVDDFIVTTDNGCHKVPGSVSNILPTSADFSIADSCAWQISYGLKGTAADNGTILSIPAGTTSTTISGFSDKTAYVAYFRRVCDATTFSAWSIPTSFKTPCLPMTLPYNEGFESVDTDDLPDCWTFFVSNTSDNDVYVSDESGFVHGGDNSLYFYQEDGSSTDYAIAALPVISGWHNADMTFYYSNHNESGGGSDKLYVGYLTVDGDASSFVQYAALPYSGSMRQYQISLADFPGNAVTPAFKYVGYMDAAIDDISIVMGDGCAKLAAYVSNVDATTADLTVTDSCAWQYVIGVAGAVDTLTSTPVSVAAGTASVQLTGLSMATLYNVYVRRDCGSGNFGAWSKAISFKTVISPTIPPFSTGFEDDTDNMKWEFVDGTGSNNWIIGSDANGVFAGSKALYVSNNGGTYGYAATSGSKSFAFRTIQFAAGEYALSFRWKCTGGESSYDFGSIMIVPESDTLIGGTGAGFTSIVFPNYIYRIKPDESKDYFNLTTGDADGWNTFNGIIDMSEYPGNYKFVVMWNNDTYTGNNYPFTIDNLRISQITCSAPNVVANSTSSDVTIQCASTGASEWEVVLNSTPIDVFGTDPVTGNIYRGVVTAPVTVNGLTPNTEYYYTARAICQPGDTSDWVTAQSVRTYCTAYNAPYAETFEDAAALSCWSSYGNVAPARNTSYHYAGSASLKVADGAAISPEFNIPSMTTYMVTGYAYSTTDSTRFSVGVMVNPDDGETFEVLGQEVIPVHGQWHEFTAYFTLLGNEDYEDFANAKHFALVVGNGSTVYFDNIQFTEVLDCPKPTEVAVSNVTAQSFDIAWKDNANTSSWVVNVVPLMGAPIKQVVTTNPATVSGLSAQTQYSVSIAAICSANDTSDATNYGVIKTACDIITLPYYETFETMTAGATPDCWDISASTSTTVTSNPAYIWGVYNYAGNNTIRMYDFFVSNGTAVINTPPIVIPAGAASELSFDYSHNANCGAFDVQVSTDNGVTFTTLASYNSNGVGTKDDPDTMTNATIQLNGYVGETIIIRFATSANYGTGAIFIDNISVAQIRDCAKPTNVNPVNVTGDQIDITWTAGGSETQWIASIQRAGHAAVNMVVDTTFVSFTGLEPTTLYQVSVAAICGAFDTSYFTNPLDVLTACGTVTTPYFEDFESYSTSVVPDCWDNSGSSTTTVSSSPSYVWGIYNVNGNNMIRMHNYLVREGTALINTPTIALPDITGTELVFKYANCADAGNLFVKISANGGATFDNLASYAPGDVTSYTVPDALSEAVVNLDAYKGNNVIIQFFVNANYNDGAVFVDDVQIIPGNVCRDITADPTVIRTTATTVTVSVPTRPTYQSVMFAYGPAAYTNTVADAVASVNSIDGSAVITGLAPSTAYKIWAIAVCESGDSTEWTNSVIATTRDNDCFEPQNLAMNGAPSDVAASMTWMSAPGALGTEWVLQSGTTTVNSGLSNSETLTFDSLTPSTGYLFKVRTVCSVGDTSDWASISFSTLASLASLPFNCNFEDSTENSKWNLINGTLTNKFYIGTAAANSGNALYISNSNGATYTYTSLQTYVFATRTFQLPAGTYEYSYDWNCNGDEYLPYRYDYGRVLLVPVDTVPVAGTRFAGYSTAGPDGAIPLDFNGTDHSLNKSTGWTSKYGTFTVPSVGNYNLVICWIDDSESEYNPPFAIDNIHLAALTCPRPTLSLTAVTDSSVTVNVTNNAECDTIIYAVSTGSFQDAVVVDTLVNQTSVVVNGLASSTNYKFYAKAICGANDESMFEILPFRTACGITALPYIESFESLPTTYTAGMLSDICWDDLGASGASGSTPYYKGYTSSSYVSEGSKCLYMYSNLNQGLILIMPDFGDANNVHLTYDSRVQNATTAGAIQVGYITDIHSESSFVSVYTTPKTTTKSSYSADVYNMPVGARVAFLYDGATRNNICASLDNIHVTQIVTGDTYNDTICHNSPYVNYGFNILANQMNDGDNTFTRIKSGVNDAADTIVTANVFMLPEYDIVTYDTVCAGVSYVSGLFNIPDPQSRSYVRTFTSSFGCDSMVTLYLTVEETFREINDTLCEGDVYTFDGQQLTAGGDYTAYTVNARGCNDTTVLHLYVVATRDTISETICNGTSYTWHGQTYTASGSYTWTGEGEYGCTLVSTLILTVLDDGSTSNVAICQGGSYLFGDTLITTAGTYTRTYYDVNVGCTLTDTIIVTIDDIITGDVYDIACEGHEYFGYGISGLTVTGDTVVSISTKTAELCDSVTNVHLTYVATKYGDEHQTINKGEAYEWYDNTYSETGTYTETLQSAEGCDSVVTLHLSVIDGVEVVNDVKVDVVPNPVRPGMTAYVYGEFGDVEAVEILNNFGQVIDRFAPSTYPIEVQGIEAAGLYYVRLIITSGDVYTEKLVVK